MAACPGPSCTLVPPAGDFACSLMYVGMVTLLPCVDEILPLSLLLSSLLSRCEITMGVGAHSAQKNPSFSPSLLSPFSTFINTAVIKLRISRVKKADLGTNTTPRIIAIPLIPVSKHTDNNLKVAPRSIAEQLYGVTTQHLQIKKKKKQHTTSPRLQAPGSLLDEGGGNSTVGNPHASGFCMCSVLPLDLLFLLLLFILGNLLVLPGIKPELTCLSSHVGWLAVKTFWRCLSFLYGLILSVVGYQPNHRARRRGTYLRIPPRLSALSVPIRSGDDGDEGIPASTFTGFTHSLPYSVSTRQGISKRIMFIQIYLINSNKQQSIGEDEKIY